MIRSMTGFARVERQLSAGRLVWELRAVNHRYLDLQLRLPDEFRAVENDLRARGSRVLSRGKIEATLRFQLQRGGAAGVDGDRLRELAAALGSVGEVIPVAPPDALAVLAWPGVLREEAMDPESLTAAVAGLFDAVIEDFRRTREAEGARIAEHLSERVAALRRLIEAVRARAPQVREAWLERLRGRIADLGTEVDPARLAQEAVLIAQRLDVDEEMSRLAGHLDEVAAVLKRDDAVGRRLDFLMQELNREANTLSSKSQDEETTRNAVEMKVLIEQMREQVQNVE